VIVDNATWDARSVPGRLIGGHHRPPRLSRRSDGDTALRLPPATDRPLPGPQNIAIGLMSRR